MTDSKSFILSVLFCLTFTVGMISYLLISDVPERIRILNQKITVTIYPQLRGILNKDIAEVTLPYLKKQRAAEVPQVEVREPDKIYMPEQLQQSRGHRRKRASLTLLYLAFRLLSW